MNDAWVIALSCEVHAVNPLIVCELNISTEALQHLHDLYVSIESCKVYSCELLLITQSQLINPVLNYRLGLLREVEMPFYQVSLIIMVRLLIKLIILFSLY